MIPTCGPPRVIAMFTLVKLCGSCDTLGGWNTACNFVASMLVVGLSCSTRISIAPVTSVAACGSVGPGRGPGGRRRIAAGGGAQAGGAGPGGRRAHGVGGEPGG